MLVAWLHVRGEGFELVDGPQIVEHLLEVDWQLVEKPCGRVVDQGVDAWVGVGFLALVRLVPALLHDTGLKDVHALLDHVQLHQPPMLRILVTECVQLDLVDAPDLWGSA
jgi:hypothetical protein